MGRVHGYRKRRSFFAFEISPLLPPVGFLGLAPKELLGFHPLLELLVESERMRRFDLLFVAEVSQTDTFAFDRQYTDRIPELTYDHSVLLFLDSLGHVQIREGGVLDHQECLLRIGLIVRIHGFQRAAGTNADHRRVAIGALDEPLEVIGKELGHGQRIFAPETITAVFSCLGAFFEIA